MECYAGGSQSEFTLLLGRDWFSGESIRHWVKSTQLYKGQEFGMSSLRTMGFLKEEELVFSIGASIRFLNKQPRSIFGFRSRMHLSINIWNAQKVRRYKSLELDCKFVWGFQICFSHFERVYVLSLCGCLIYSQRISSRISFRFGCTF